MIRAFLLGWLEFRSNYTTRCHNARQREAYDWGREWRHRINFRVYEP